MELNFSFILKETAFLILKLRLLIKRSLASLKRFRAKSILVKTLMTGWLRSDSTANVCLWQKICLYGDRGEHFGINRELQFTSSEWLENWCWEAWKLQVLECIRTPFKWHVLECLSSATWTRRAEFSWSTHVFARSGKPHSVRLAKWANW